MSSTAGDFRNLTPLVLMDALQQAGTVVYEPMHRFRLEIPADTLGPCCRCWRGCARCREAPSCGGSSCVLEGDDPGGAGARAASSSCRR